MSKFVILGGVPRSGTNLARRIIGSHSKIAIPNGEFQFFNQLAIGKSVSEILDNERVKKWEVDLAPYRDSTPQEAFVGVLEDYTKKVGKEISGEKTPLNEFFFDELLKYFAEHELRFIHLVRNPFDVLASYKHMKVLKRDQNYDLNEISFHMRNWQRSMILGLARANTHPDQYLVLRYEALATEPVALTKKICEFIGVDFEEERMLQLSDYSGHRDNTSFATAQGSEHETYQAIKAPVSRKGHLNETEIRRICETCGEAARAFGYDDPDFEVFPPERGNSGGSVYKKLKGLARILKPMS
jgi:hypothetical protein